MVADPPRSLTFVSRRRLRVAVALLVGVLSACTGGSEEAPPPDARFELVANQPVLPDDRYNGLALLATTPGAVRREWKHFRLKGDAPSGDLLFVGFGEPCSMNPTAIDLDGAVITISTPETRDGGCTDAFRPRTLVYKVQPDTIPEGQVTVRVLGDGVQEFILERQPFRP